MLIPGAYDVAGISEREPPLNLRVGYSGGA